MDLLGEMDRSSENRTEPDCARDCEEQKFTRGGKLDLRWKKEDAGEENLELVDDAKADAVAVREDSFVREQNRPCGWDDRSTGSLDLVDIWNLLERETLLLEREMKNGIGVVGFLRGLRGVGSANLSSLQRLIYSWRNWGWIYNLGKLQGLM